MRIVAVTGESFNSPWQQYMLWRLRQEVGLAGIVTTHRRPQPGRLRRYARLIRRRGLLGGLGEIAGIIPNTIYTRRIWQKVESELLSLTPLESLAGVDVVDGGMLNTQQCADAIASLDPDVLYQCGAGIIKPITFNAARLGMVNLHHGIIPQIRGCASALWAVRELRPDWLGVSAHMVDEGIDTGGLFAQGRPGINNGDKLPQILTRLQILGADVLVAAMKYLKTGGRAAAALKDVPSIYRSHLTFWDWMILAMRVKGFVRLYDLDTEKISIGRYLYDPKSNGYQITDEYHDRKKATCQGKPLVSKSSEQPRA